MKRQGVYRYLIYIAIFSVFTSLFFLYGFPAERLTSIVNGRLSTMTGSAASVDEASLGFPLALKLKGMETAWSGESVLLGDAFVSPDLVGLLTGKKGGRIRLKGPLGTARLSIRTGGPGARITVKSLVADLQGVSGALQSPVQVDGFVEGSAAFETADLASGKWNGRGTVKADSVILTGPLLEAFGMAPFELAGLKAAFSLEENLLTLGENSIEGDLGASARGTIRLVPARPGSSRLDLVVDLRPGIGMREKISPLLTLMGARPRADGSVQLKVRGTVGRPSVTS
ncbi:MAG: type II secretion system protein GspN [bacterium]|nr:type II secretion system protein GspN [bacterium]